MKAIKYAVSLVVVMAATAGCLAVDKPAGKENTDTDIVVEGNNKFALELYQKLRAEEGNLFFSPYSISTALAMTYAGARGQTERQMAEVLHFPVISGVSTGPVRQHVLHCAFGEIIKDLNARGEKGGYELTVANALWGQEGYGFLGRFLELVKTNYGGGLNEVDFVQATEAARQAINAWVEKETNNKIKNLIGKGVLDSMTRLVLTNAIYFKGNWARQFEEDKTKDAPFTLSNGEKTNVSMMNQTAEFKYMETDSFQALELPYVDDELSMFIFLPKEADGIGGFEETLTAEDLSGWLAKLRKREVIVSIPKFKQTSRFGLANVLASMGMGDAFSPAKADFSGMTGGRELFISAVIHKAYVHVNEEGTEAAAATGVAMKLTSVAPRAVVFRAAHPFLFLIRDNSSGSILFIGRMMNPKTSSPQ